MPPGHVSLNNVADGQVADGQVAVGQVAVGQVAEGQVALGQVWPQVFRLVDAVPPPLLEVLRRGFAPSAPYWRETSYGRRGYSSFWYDVSLLLLLLLLLLLILPQLLLREYRF